MADFLQQIVAQKRRELAETAGRVPLASVRRLAALRRDYRGFAAALAVPRRVRIVAEIKRASPSKGDLAPGLNPAAVARAYEAGGAAAVSVLTERAFFKGSPEDLAAARAATALPVLRKDFIVDEYQVYETAAMGADAMLLIVRLLTDVQLAHLHGLARSLGLDVLVEVYDEAEAARANRLGTRLVGINNRDLARFDTDVTRAQRVAGALAPDVTVVAASAIGGADAIRRAFQAGISRFLVGESLVRAPDPTGLLRAWSAMRQAEIKICGLTSPEAAAACADAGADAIGLVFHPSSPRHLTIARAREIAAALPAHVAKVGVLVDQDDARIRDIARQVGLTAVQLHASRQPLSAPAPRTIAVLTDSGVALLDRARAVAAEHGVLVECGRGQLPGGNGAAWNWSEAKPLAPLRPFAIAGGLAPSNVAAALSVSGATAVDVSSGVEAAPGIKDLARVKDFIAAARSGAPVAGSVFAS